MWPAEEPCIKCMDGNVPASLAGKVPATTTATEKSGIISMKNSYLGGFLKEAASINVRF